MIDENKLIERLQKCVNASDNSNFTNGLLSAIDIANQQPKIGGWIPYSERLPEEKMNPVTKDFYEYQVTFRSEDVTDVRRYKFGNGH